MPKTQTRLTNRIDRLFFLILRAGGIIIPLIGLIAAIFLKGYGCHLHPTNNPRMNASASALSTPTATSTLPPLS